jgi:hypothetical protein
MAALISDIRDPKNKNKNFCKNKKQKLKNARKF